MPSRTVSGAATCLLLAVRKSKTKSKSHTKRIRGCLRQSVIVKLEHSLYGDLWRMMASTCPCLAAHRSGVSPVTLGVSLFALPKPCQSRKGQGILGEWDTKNAQKHSPSRERRETASTAMAAFMVWSGLQALQKKPQDLSLAFFWTILQICLTIPTNLLHQLWDSESEVAAPTWPPCEAMSTGVLSGTNRVDKQRDGWANAWAAQRH